MNDIFIPQALYGIIGHPLGHSLSPAIHNQAFAALAVPAVYLAWPLPPEGLGDFMRALRTLPISGLSVTIPHKTAVMGHLDAVSEAAARAGAVNTLYWREGRLLGENTDIAGFVRPLMELGGVPGPVLVLGAGGAARAVLAGLEMFGAQGVLVSARDPDKASALARAFSARPWPWDKRGDAGASLVVNTTPLGMAGELAAQTPFPAGALFSGMTVYDLIYNPATTRLLAEAKAAGCRTISGREMFVEQAAGQFALWTGRELPRGPAMETIARALG